MNNEILFASLHNIDCDSYQTTKIDINNIGGDINDYISALMTDIFENENFRHYRLDEDNLEIFNYIHSILTSSNECDSFTEIIAQKYLSAERIGQERYQRFGEGNIIKRGYLIQVLCSDDDYFYYFVSKVELNSYLGELTWSKELGMPYGDKILKTCLYRFNKESYELDDIFVQDKYNSMYWKDAFLHLKECNSDVDSTKKMFNLIERQIEKGGKTSKADVFELKNQLIAYFSMPRKFNYENMDAFLFNDYTPICPDLININDIRTKIQARIKDNQLDTIFEIVPKALKSKLQTTLDLNNFMKLKIKGIDSYKLRDYIHSEKRNNESYLVIKVSDDVFQKFREEENS